MPVYLDVESRLDRTVLAATAREIRQTFDALGKDISHGLGGSLSQAFRGFDTSAARQELLGLQQEYARLRDAELEAARVAQRSASEVEVAERRKAEAVAKYTAESSQAARAQAVLADTQARAARDMRTNADAILATEAAHRRLGDATEDSAATASRAATVFNGVGIASVVGFGAAMAETTRKAGDFQLSQQRLVSSAGESASDLRTVSDGLLKMAGEVGYSAQELSKGMYIVESGGFHGAEGLNVMRAAAQGAKAEQADLTTVNNALTTSLHDFGFGSDRAADVMSKMIAAIGSGKTTIQEFAGSLHSVEPAAAAAHIKLEDVYATLAMMTQSGESAEQATENMRNAINSLAQPTSQQREAMSQFGVSADDVSQKLGERGLAGTMQYLSEAILKHMDPSGKIAVSELNQNAQAARNATMMLDQMSPAARQVSEAFAHGSVTRKEYMKATLASNDADSAKMKQFLALENTVNGFSTRFKNGKDIIETYNAALKDVTGTVAGQTVALQVTGDHAEETNALIKKLTDTNREADGTVKGFNETQETLNAKMAQSKAAFGAAAIELGTTFVPMMTDVANVAKTVGDFLAKHPEIAHDVVTALEVMGGAWLAIKAYNIASTILSPIASGLGMLIGKLGGVEAQAATAGGAMRSMGAAAGEGVAGVEAAATAEVAAEERVAMAATDARAAMGGGAGAGAGGSAGRSWMAAAGPLGITAFAADAISDAERWADQRLGGDYLERFAQAPGSAIWAMNQLKGHAEGGPLHASGPKGRDSALFWGADGEHVLTHPEVQKMGGHPGVYQFRQDLMSGNLVLRREYGGAIGDDAGGPISRLYQEARTLNGGRYVWGSTDCSGAVSMLVDAALGTSGRMSTATAQSWLAQKGFQPGMGGPGSLSIGWYNGGPGGGHMAATLPDGTHFESGGQHGGIMLGGSAAGAESSQFTSHMHLPLQGFYPDGPAGGMGGFGMPGGAGGFGGGGFGGAGAIPPGSTAGTGPGGQPGYYTPNPGRVASEQERLRHLDAEIANAEKRRDELKSTAKQSERDRLDEEIRHLKEERAQAQTKLQEAERGTFHAGRGGRGGAGGSPFLPVPLADRFGLGKGLPGLAEWVVGFLEDLALGPMETAVMAGLGGGFGGGLGGSGMADALGPLTGGPLGGADFGGGIAPEGGGGGGSIPGPSGGYPTAAGASGGAGASPWWAPGSRGADKPRSIFGGVGGATYPMFVPGMGMVHVPDAVAPFGGRPGAVPGSGGAPDEDKAVLDFLRGAGGWFDHTFVTHGGSPYPIWQGHGFSGSGGRGSAPGERVPGGASDLSPFAGAGHHATGGPIGHDTIPAWLSEDEFVEQPSAVRKYGEPFMAALNRGDIDPSIVQYHDEGGSTNIHQQMPQAPPPAPKPQQPGQPGAPGQKPPGAPQQGGGPLKLAGPPLPADAFIPQGAQTRQGLIDPGSSKQLFGEGLPPSPGIGFGGGLLGAAEGAASQAAGMAASMGSFGAGGGAASSATQMMFQMLNRTAAYGAQAAGIGVEAAIQTLSLSDSPLSDFGKTLPGKLLAGIAGVRPAQPNSAGQTKSPLTSDQAPGAQGEGGGQSFHVAGDVNVHPRNFDDMVNQIADRAQRQSYSQAQASYPMNKP